MDDQALERRRSTQGEQVRSPAAGNRALREQNAGLEERLRRLEEAAARRP